MSAAEGNTRFARHGLIPGWNQSRLDEATVVIVGMGALGNECARLLAMAGVGTLIICDFDRIEVSNLSRTALFRESDVGQFKVNAAQRALRDLAPEMHVDARNVEFRRAVGLGELRDASIVLGCLDSRAARLEMVGRCCLVGAPIVDGGTHPWGGEVRIYLDDDGPCYGCGLTPVQRGESTSPDACGQHTPVGASAPISAMVATWMTTVAIRYIMRLQHPTGTLVLDGMLGSVRQIDHRRDENCPLHERIPASTRIDVSAQHTVSQLLDTVPTGATVECWTSFQEGTQCRVCDHFEESWAAPQARDCPRCGGFARPRLTRWLSEAPSDILLVDLGIAPGEILPVRHDGEICYVELVHQCERTPIESPSQNQGIPSAGHMMNPSEEARQSEPPQSPPNTV